MAGGIEWFRWHHGSVTDPKFQLVARKADARLGDVIAVWAYVLEQASAATNRGVYGDIDCEAVDCLLGCDDGTTDAILAAMRDRGLLNRDTGTIVSWEKRQPKREREDDKSTERVQAFRARQRQGTPRNANENQETPRGEEKREESYSEANASAAGTAGGVDNASPRMRCPAEQAKSDVWQSAVDVLANGGCKVEATARTFMGKLVSDYTFEIVKDAVAATVAAQPADAREYLKATCMRLKGERKDAPAPLTVPSNAAEITKAYLESQKQTPEQEAAAALARKQFLAKHGRSREPA